MTGTGDRNWDRNTGRQAGRQATCPFMHMFFIMVKVSSFKRNNHYEVMTPHFIVTFQRHIIKYRSNLIYSNARNVIMPMW